MNIARSIDVLRESKPIEHFNKVIKSLEPFAITKKTLQPRTKITNLIESENCWVLLKEGVYEVRKKNNRTVVITVKGPHILSLTGAEYVYVQVIEKAEVCFVSADTALAQVREQSLWESMYYILEHNINGLFIGHSISSVTNSTYQTIKNLLVQLDKEPYIIKSSTTALIYIQEHSLLSRSRIADILSNLKRGGYIVTNKGILVSINHLPEKY